MSQDDCWQNMRIVGESDTPLRRARLAEYPRYAKAAEHRISRLNGQYLKDQKALDMLTPGCCVPEERAGLPCCSAQRRGVSVPVDARGVSRVALCPANETRHRYRQKDSSNSGKKYRNGSSRITLICP